MSIPQCLHLKLNNPQSPHPAPHSYSFIHIHPLTHTRKVLFTLNLYNVLQSNSHLYIHTYAHTHTVGKLTEPPPSHATCALLVLWTCAKVLSIRARSPWTTNSWLSEYSHLHLNSTLIASQVNNLYSKASIPYAIQLHFTLAMALENKNVSFTYLVHKKILHAKYSLKSFGNRCYLCLLFV